MEKMFRACRGMALFLIWASNIFIAYSAANSLVPGFMNCLPLAYIFYWLLEGIDEIKFKQKL